MTQLYLLARKIGGVDHYLSELGGWVPVKRYWELGYARLYAAAELEYQLGRERRTWPDVFGLQVHVIPSDLKRWLENRITTLELARSDPDLKQDLVIERLNTLREVYEFIYQDRATTQPT